MEEGPDRNSEQELGSPPPLAHMSATREECDIIIANWRMSLLHKQEDRRLDSLLSK